jgi:hypothetical protein
MLKNGAAWAAMSVCQAPYRMVARAARAGEPWTDAHQAGPFLCRAGFALQPYVPLFEELARLQSDLVRTLGIARAREFVEVYLFRDRQAYQNHLKQYLPQVPYRRALYVKRGRSSRVLVYQHRDFPTDLRHEATHALLHAALDMVPLWLDEGLAEYFELPATERARGVHHLQALRWNLRLGVMTPLANLEKKAELEEMGQLEYRFAWAWVHFMLHGPAKARESLVRYLADIQAGTPPGQLSQRLTASIPDVERQMVAHIKSLSQNPLSRIRGAGSVIGIG